MGAASPHWDLADWDQLTLGSTQLPGVWVIDGRAERRIDIKTRKGEDAARIKDEGYQNAPLTLIGRMSTQAQYDEMMAALREIHPRRKGAARDPLTLNHPAATAIGVTSVYVVAIDSPRLDNGIAEFRIEVLEWIEQPKKLPKRAPKIADYGAFGGGGATLGDVRRSLQGSVYTGDYGIKRTDTGYSPPSETAEQAEVNEILAEVQAGL